MGLLAQNARTELDVRQSTLCSSRSRVSAELVQQLAVAQDCHDMAIRRQALVNLAASASRKVEDHLPSRAAVVADALPACEALSVEEQALDAAFAQTERARQHDLQELLVSWTSMVWGPDAGVLSRNHLQVEELRRAHMRVLAAVE